MGYLNNRLVYVEFTKRRTAKENLKEVFAVNRNAGNTILLSSKIEFNQMKTELI